MIWCRINKQYTEVKNMGVIDVCGCIHIHTTFSDGGCSYPALIKAAQKAGLDFIAVTDHMDMTALRDGRQGLHDRLFVIVGYEHNDAQNLNHYLAFGTPDTVKGVTEPQEYIDRVKAAGGFGFLAHPAEKRDYFTDLPPYPWTKNDVSGFDGIEVWNQISEWMERLRGRKIFFPDRVMKFGAADAVIEAGKLFFPNRLIGGAPQELLARWDEANRTRFVSGIGGVDAHTRKFSFGPLSYRIFPIKTELRGVRTHLYIDEAARRDESKIGGAILAAMRDGKGFISNFYRGDARGTRIFLRDANNAVEYPGRPVSALPLPLTLNADFPQKARIMLLRNGETVEETAGKSAAWTIEKTGVYRVEAYKGRRAWIYSNPFPVGEYPL